jgi:hypothetical protein
MKTNQIKIDHIFPHLFECSIFAYVLTVDVSFIFQS